MRLREYSFLGFLLAALALIKLGPALDIPLQLPKPRFFSSHHFDISWILPSYFLFDDPLPRTLIPYIDHLHLDPPSPILRAIRAIVHLAA